MLNKFICWLRGHDLYLYMNFDKDDRVFEVEKCKRCHRSTFKRYVKVSQSKCPECGGRGIILASDEHYSPVENCMGCGGQGWR